MLVEQAIIEAGGFDVTAAEIDRLTTEWATALRRLSDRVAVAAPFTARAVEPGLEIVELSNGEIAAAL